MGWLVGLWSALSVGLVYGDDVLGVIGGYGLVGWSLVCPTPRHSRLDGGVKTVINQVTSIAIISKTHLRAGSIFLKRLMAYRCK